MDPLAPGFDPSVVAGLFVVAVVAVVFWRWLLVLAVVGFVTLTLIGFDRVWMALRG